jgi:hypothetical protein
VVPADKFLAYQRDREIDRKVRLVESGEDLADVLDYRNIQRLLALRREDVIVMESERAAGLWWFVHDVDGPNRTITARTLIFDQPREETFSFALVEPLPLFTAAEHNQAAVYRNRPGSSLPRPAAPSVSRRAWAASVVCAASCLAAAHRREV